MPDTYPNFDASSTVILTNSRDVRHKEEKLGINSGAKGNDIFEIAKKTITDGSLTLSELENEFCLDTFHKKSPPRLWEYQEVGRGILGSSNTDFDPIPDLEWSINSRIIIKSIQDMFPNKILVKLVNLYENLDCKSVKIVI